jgi:hypothetical protein
MLVNTDTAGYELAGAPLEYVRSALEYLVPLPATLLVAHYFGDRWRRLNQGVFVAFAALAGFGIPFELITPRLRASDTYRATPVSDLLRFQQAEFSALFTKSAIKRAKLAGMQRNVETLTAAELRGKVGA